MDDLLAKNLASCVGQLQIQGTRRPQGWDNPALNLIDCVLSLHQRYGTTVLPRLKSFRSDHPQIQSLQELSGLIDNSGGAIKFLYGSLQYNSKGKAETLAGVLHYLISAEPWLLGKSQMVRLEDWAKSFSPDDYLSSLPLVDHDKVTGFGFTGFQYLRILFGADAVKPDVWIKKFISDCLVKEIASRRRISTLLERASLEVGKSPRDVDLHIWKQYSQGRDYL